MKIRVLGCGGSFGSPLAWGKNGNIDINSHTRILIKKFFNIQLPKSNFITVRKR